MLSKISEYKIFKGNPTELNPEDDFKLYELSSALFTDYAEKKRFIKVPKGYKLKLHDNLLPDFPDGTILVKTFYYYNDKRDPSKGNRLIETRLLIKLHSKWVLGTYIWNNEQTDAELITKGEKLSVEWIDELSNNRNINYQIPNSRNCMSCHNADNLITPIGFKTRNINRDVVRDNKKVNQLAFFKKKNLVDFDTLSAFSALPNWQDKANSLEQRARAYFDINCAHCHNEKGSCKYVDLKLGYEIPILESEIISKKNRITTRLSNGSMPRLGTTIIHKEGLDLIKQYIISLK